MFLKAMSKFTTGITIVTMKEDGKTIGMTVNAFMSISLDPMFVAISIDKNANMHDKFYENQKVGISILKEGQKMISQFFAKQIKKKVIISYMDLEEVPVIKDSLVMLSGEVKKSFKAGDHTIFLVKIMDININEGEPLLYFDSNYQKLCYEI